MWQLQHYIYSQRPYASPSYVCHVQIFAILRTFVAWARTSFALSYTPELRPWHLLMRCQFLYEEFDFHHSDCRTPVSQESQLQQNPVAAMALATALAAICPQGPAADQYEDTEMATLHTSDGHVLPVLGGLLQARCPKLHGDGAKAFYAGEELTVVLPLLQWVYSGRVQDQPVSAGCGDCALFARMLQLAEGWGLRDAGELQDLLLAKRSRRRRSSLAEDLLAAYRSGHLRSVVFYCPTFKDEDEEVGLWPLDGGLATLLQLRSEYFRAMFRGGWAESVSANWRVLGEQIGGERGLRMEKTLKRGFLSLD
ncbi:hypothetical protein AK812_SmicGene27705 [Symbiodinium microadriaticum]|uniref:Uncharacterized protein n=1 Tax=Symbiodinium microadriaticum TaxID=2951 RepID=A0A1Q9D634_SYMMI|nr:hypothetical protein AK812_SmicGene27705 [Symbiodinium microadriaticum]